MVLILLSRATRTKNKDWLGDKEDGREGDLGREREVEDRACTMGKNPAEIERRHSKFGRAEEEEVDEGRARH